MEMCGHHDDDDVVMAHVSDHRSRQETQGRHVEAVFIHIKQFPFLIFSVMASFYSATCRTSHLVNLTNYEAARNPKHA